MQEKMYFPYLVILSITMLSEIICLVLIHVYREKAIAIVYSDLEFYQNKKYDGQLNDEQSKIFSNFMASETCCGLNGSNDFQSDNTLWHSKGFISYNGKSVNPQSQNPQLKTPPFCCTLIESFSTDMYNEPKSFVNFIKNLNSTNSCPFSLNANNLNKEGCFSVLGQIKFNIALVSTICICILIAIQTICFASALYMKSIVDD